MKGKESSDMIDSVALDILLLFSLMMEVAWKLHGTTYNDEV